MKDVKDVAEQATMLEKIKDGNKNELEKAEMILKLTT